MSGHEYRLIADVQRIREALRIRGFSVRTLHNRLLPEHDGPRHEWRDLEEVLKEAGVIFRSSDRHVTLLDVPDPETAALSIRFASPRYAMQRPRWYDANWKTFTRRIFARPHAALSLPPGTAYLVQSMTAAGMMVAYADDGRAGRAPYIELAGPYFGVWFRYWFENHLALEAGGLHFPWIIRRCADGSCRLTIARTAGISRGDRILVQQDAVRMGDWLMGHGWEIRELRRILFKYRSMKREAKRLAGDPAALQAWMYERIGDVLR